MTDSRVEILMRNLGITEQEALSVLASDKEVDKMPDSQVNADLTPEQQKASKEMRQADRKKATAPVKKERKPNEDKRTLVRDIKCLLEGLGCEVEMTNPERELNLVFNGTKYKVVLSAPRK